MNKTLSFAVVLLILLSLPLDAGTRWVHQDNSTCINDRDPEEFCTGAGQGNGDGKWHLDTSLTDIKWLQACTARSMSRGEVPVCTTERQASTGLDSCPATEDGNRFPVRRVDDPLIQHGDGTFGGATGVSPDVDFDKWPGGKWDNRPELQISRDKWDGTPGQTDGVWSQPWTIDCRTLLRDLVLGILDRDAIDGEAIIDLQSQPIAETTPEE